MNNNHSTPPAHACPAQPGVAALVHVPTGGRYLGAFPDLRSAYNRTRLQLSAGLHPNRSLQGLWKEYGEDSFTWEPVIVLNRDTKPDRPQLLALLRLCLAQDGQAQPPLPGAGIKTPVRPSAGAAAPAATPESEESSMDNVKIGQLIFQLRTEQGLTQQQLGEQLGVSNKTISKWECGNGAHEPSLWAGLSLALGADVLKLLEGELRPNRPNPGRMDRIRFYVCPSCGNQLTSTGAADLSCCGRRLSPLAANVDTDNCHTPKVAEMDGGFYVTLPHPMTKEHHFAFAACVHDDRLWFQRLYPEQDCAFQVPDLRGRGILYLYCTQHGLFRFPRFPDLQP